MENTLTVEFRLIGRGFVPTELSRDLGKECSEYELGDDRKSTFWILSKTKTGTIDIKSLCQELISELQPMQEKLCRLIEKFDLHPDFCVWLKERPRTDHEVLYGERPVSNFCIEPATMRFLSAINAPIFIEHEFVEPIDVHLEPVDPRADIFALIMNPKEWIEVYALAGFAHAGLEYDCSAPYVIQVFTYDFTQPEDIWLDKDMQSAFEAVARLSEAIPADGKILGNITLALPKEPMRELFIVLEMASWAEEQANRLSVAADEFPYRFPDLLVSSRQYAEAFGDLLGALHEGKSLTINLHAIGDPPPKLDMKHLPPEILDYLKGKIAGLIAQNPEEYAGDPRTVEIQIEDLVNHINTEALIRFKAAAPANNPSAVAQIPKSQFDELKSRVEKTGGTISGPFTADQLQSQLSPEEWSKITKIDPEVIKAEEQRQNVASLPNLIRYRHESSLAKLLLEDKRIIPYLQGR